MAASPKESKKPSRNPAAWVRLFLDTEVSKEAFEHFRKDNLKTIADNPTFGTIFNLLHGLFVLAYRHTDDESRRLTGGLDYLTAHLPRFTEIINSWAALKPSGFIENIISVVPIGLVDKILPAPKKQKQFPEGEVRFVIEHWDGIFDYILANHRMDREDSPKPTKREAEEEHEATKKWLGPEVRSDAETHLVDMWGLYKQNAGLTITLPEMKKAFEEMVIKKALGESRGRGERER